MARPAQLVRVGAGFAVVAVLVTLLAGCGAGSPQDAAKEAWNRHLRLVTKDMIRDGALVDPAGSPAVGSACRRGGRIDDYVLYACTVDFADGTRWGGVVRVNDDGTAFIRTALHPLDADHGPARP